MNQWLFRVSQVTCYVFTRRSNFDRLLTKAAALNIDEHGARETGNSQSWAPTTKNATCADAQPVSTPTYALACPVPQLSAHPKLHQSAPHLSARKTQAFGTPQSAQVPSSAEVGRQMSQSARSGPRYNVSATCRLTKTTFARFGLFEAKNKFDLFLIGLPRNFWDIF